MQTIMRIDSGSVHSIGGGRYVITAVGTVSTAGWTHPAITGAEIVSLGQLDYEFQAEPPHGPSLQVLSQVSASAQIGGPGTSLAGLTTIRISASQGVYEIPFPPSCG